MAVAAQLQAGMILAPVKYKNLETYDFSNKIGQFSRAKRYFF
jgi:hypothetical protein